MGDRIRRDVSAAEQQKKPYRSLGSGRGLAMPVDLGDNQRDPAGRNPRSEAPRSSELSPAYRRGSPRFQPALFNMRCQQQR